MEGLRTAYEIDTRVLNKGRGRASYLKYKGQGIAFSQYMQPSLLQESSQLLFIQTERLKLSVSAFFFFLTEFDFSLLRSYVGVENSYRRLNQSDNKVTPTATWLFAFSRASSSLFIYILNSPQVCNICLFTDWKLRLIPALAYLRRRILIYFEPHHKVRQ